LAKGVGAIALAIAWLSCVPSTWAAEGDLDPTFGSGGRVVAPVAPVTGPAAVTVDSQGRIVAVGGRSPNLAVTRFLPSGALDTSFSGDGVATFDPTAGAANGAALADAVAIDPQGRILVAGCVGEEGGLGSVACADFILIRVGTDGQLDSGFGPAASHGFVRQDFFGDTDIAHAVAIDSQGRILVGGTERNFDNDFGVARFDSTGMLDASFGGSGKPGIATVDFTPLASDDDRADAMAVDAQGRIVLAGSSTRPPADELAVARLSSDGTRDASFGTDFGSGHFGEVTTPIGSSSDANAVTIDPQGRILAAGSAFDGTSKFLVARYNPDGSLDTSFSDDGIVTSSPGDPGEIFTVGLDSQGRIVAAGQRRTSGTTRDVAVARYLPSGAADQAFGAGGLVIVPNGDGRSGAIDAQDRILASASQTGNFGAVTTFELVRLIGDATAPSVSVVAGAAEGAVINDPTPTFEFSSSETGGIFTCGFDGLSATCTSPFTPGAALSDGAHTFSVSATDRAENTSTAATRTFTVDTKAPEVDISGKKKFKTRKKKVRAELRIETSEQAGLTCAVDKKQPEDCVARFVTPKLKKGKHTVTVTATDRAGNSSTETKRIKVVRKH
jgi:uncharacterized delta-60 repeat protein